MADQDQTVDTDYSGRPYRRLSVEEMLQAPLPEESPYDLIVDLPDGRRAVDVRGRYYLRGDDGWPDWEQPIHLPGLSDEPPRPGDLTIQLDQPK